MAFKVNPTQQDNSKLNPIHFLGPIGQAVSHLLSGTQTTPQGPSNSFQNVNSTLEKLTEYSPFPITHLFRASLSFSNSSNVSSASDPLDPITPPPSAITDLEQEFDNPKNKVAQFLQPFIVALKNEKDPDKLHKLFDRLVSNPDFIETIQPYFKKSGDPKKYGRTRIVYDQQIYGHGVEVVAMVWEKGQGSIIHNHGRSAGFEYVIKGNGLLETIYKIRQKENGETVLEEVAKREVKPKTPTGIYHGDIHKVESSQETVLALNFYWPPIIFDQKTFQGQIVEESSPTQTRPLGDYDPITPPKIPPEFYRFVEVIRKILNPKK